MGVALALMVGFGAGAASFRQARGGRLAPARQRQGVSPEAIHPVATTIRSTVVLDGTVVQDEPVEVRAPIAGLVKGDLPAVGVAVKKGDQVATLRGPAPASQGITPAGAPPGITFTGPLGVARAQVTGVVTSVLVRSGQVVAQDEALALIAPPSFRIEAVVVPDLLFRFYGPPLDIQAQFDRGPAPFHCPFVSVGARIAQGADAQSAPVMLVCRAPSDVQLFAGVKTRVAVTTALAERVVAIPLTAVDGSAGRGLVTVVSGGDRRERREIQLGINDGVLVEVKSGLSVRELILNLAPSLLPLVAP